MVTLLSLISVRRVNSITFGNARCYISSNDEYYYLLSPPAFLVFSIIGGVAHGAPPSFGHVLTSLQGDAAGIPIIFNSAALVILLPGPSCGADTAARLLCIVSGSPEGKARRLNQARLFAWAHTSGK